jgi:3-oxoadipate enol-lactonase
MDDKDKETRRMTQLNIVKQGQGPLLVLSHALGCDLHMWDGVAAILEKDFTVLRYDQRCHGKSACPTGPFTVDDLADDLAALIQQQNAGPAIVAGLSLGGMVAQSIAARHPQLVKAIVIANSGSFYDDAARGIWQARIETVNKSGIAPIVDGALQRWFTPEYMADSAAAPRLDAIRKTLSACDPAGYAASCAAVAGIDYRESNKSIKCPTLIIAGSKDMATPPAMSEAMQQQIPGAKLETIAGAHLSAVEMPAEFASIVKKFAGNL